MSPDLISALALVIILFVLLGIGLEIAWAVGIVAVVGLVFFVNQPLYQIAWTAWSTLDSFTLTAVPLFILMGAILANTGVNEYLFAAIDKWIGTLPGGLAVTAIGGNAIFGAMCGSSIAAVATFGKIAYPAMESRGYDPKLALGSIAIGSILSPLIPPSILLILYCAWQSLSILRAFAAAIVPGLMLTSLLIATIIIWVKINPKLVPPSPRVSWKERLIATKNMLPFILVIVGVLGVIFGGIMTPTEAAAAGVFLSLILTLAYKRLNLSILRASLLDMVKVTTFAMFILATATLLSHVLNIIGITETLKEYVLGLPIGKYGTLVLILLMYLIMGMFFDSWSMLFITFPFVMPIIIGLGIDPIWFGVIYVMAGEQCLVTPPFGMSLFILKSVVPQQSMENIVRGSLPFLIPVYVNIVILTIFPNLVMWLPNLLR